MPFTADERSWDVASNLQAEWDLSETQQPPWRLALAHFHALEWSAKSKAPDFEQFTFPSRASLLAIDLSSSAINC